MESEREDSPRAGGAGGSAVPGLWPLWSGWVEWIVQWQQAWASVWLAWPGARGVRSPAPLFWRSGVAVPVTEDRRGPVAGDASAEAPRVPAMMRLPRLGCVGPADLDGMAAFVTPPTTAVGDPTSTMGKITLPTVPRKAAVKAPDTSAIAKGVAKVGAKGAGKAAAPAAKTPSTAAADKKPARKAPAGKVAAKPARPAKA